MLEQQLPKVGVAVLVVKDGKILLGKRKGDRLATEMFEAPGGHLENGESIIECGTREIREETGLEIQSVRFVCVSNIIDFLPHHYVVVGLVSDWKSGEARVCEEEKCSNLGWFALDALPSQLTHATADVIEAYRTGRVMFDSK